MSTVTRPAKSRTVRLTADRSAMVIHERTGKGAVKVETYFLAPVAGGYRLTKSDCTHHVVCLDGTAPACDCKGHQHYAHKSGFACRHVAALRRLVAEGRLPEPVCSACNGAGGPVVGDRDSDGCACRGCGL
jgi:hypothetical protein